MWLDALVTNVDRTPRNPNLLVWHERLWLIDHGAALFFHHRDWDPEADAAKPFPGIADHVLLPGAGSVAEADARLAERLTPDVVRAAVERVPAEWADAERYVRVPDPPTAPPRREEVECREPEPFQYAIVRVVPRVERGECMNVGVVFFCRPRRYLAARIALDEARLAAFAPELDLAEVRAHLEAMERIAAGDAEVRAGRAARPVRALPLARRAVEHGDPDFAGAHRPVRRPRGDARTS